MKILIINSIYLALAAFSCGFATCNYFHLKTGSKPLRSDEGTRKDEK